MVFTVSTKNFIGEDITISSYEDGQEIPVAFIDVLDKDRKDEATLFAAQISSLLNGGDTFGMKSDSRVFFERHPNGFSLRHKKDDGPSAPTMSIRINTGLPEYLAAYVGEKIVPDKNADTAMRLCRSVMLAAPQPSAPQSGMRP